MGRNSSGTRGGLQQGDATYKGSVGKPEPLVNMKDPALYKATKEAISRYHSVLGVRQKNVKLAELSAGTYGVHVTANGLPLCWFSYSTHSHSLSCVRLPQLFSFA